MNFDFFISQGFTADRATFLERIFYHMGHMGIYYLTFFIGVFFTGVLVSYFTVSVFNQIEAFALDFFENSKISFQGKFSHKLLNRTTKILFEYLSQLINKGHTNAIDIPLPLIKLKNPPHDKAFSIKYFSIITIICGVFYFLQQETLDQLYQSLAKEALGLKTSQFLISNFVVPQNIILKHFQIFNLFLCFLGYTVLYFHVSNRVNGVSYGFIRDMVQIIKGHHQTRLRPRFKDPGQEMAQTVNELLDELLGEESSKQIIPEPAPPSKEYKPIFDSLSELNLPPNELIVKEEDPQSLEVKSPVIKMMIKKPIEEELQTKNKKKGP